MSAVVDASVLVAALVDSGTEGSWAEDVVANGPLLSPHLVLVETTNVLRRCELVGELTRLEAAAALRDLLRLDLALLPFEPFSARIWELRANVTSYDAWYVAAAEATGLPLATLDRSLSRAPGPACEFLTPDP